MKLIIQNTLIAAAVLIGVGFGIGLVTRLVCFGVWLSGIPCGLD